MTQLIIVSTISVICIAVLSVMLYASRRPDNIPNGFVQIGQFNGINMYISKLYVRTHGSRMMSNVLNGALEICSWHPHKYIPENYPNGIMVIVTDEDDYTHIVVP